MNDNLERKRTQVIVTTALMSALVMSVTLFTQIPLATGYLNLGDLPILILACLMPLRVSILAAGIGSALADLFGGAPLYAIFTLFIKIIEVLIVHAFARYLPSKKRVIPFGLAVLAMLVLYAFVDVFLMGELNYFGVSFVSNLPQALVSSVLAVVLYPQFIRIKKYLRGV